MKRIVHLNLLFLLLFVAAQARADGPFAPRTPTQPKPANERPGPPDYLPLDSEKSFKLPPAPKQPDAKPGGASFFLNGATFKGNTVFTDEDLQAAAAPFLDRAVTPSDIEELRYHLTRHYVDNGYVNSGAIIESNQNVDDGTITFLIQEGHLNDVEVSGNGRLRSAYVRNRIWPDSEEPFNTETLQQRFQMLLQNPLIDRMDGRIRPGLTPGEAFLDLDVARAKPYALSITGDNHRPPSTGAERVTAAGTLWNLTGFGDRLDASFGISEGADEASVGYAIPLTAQDTRLSLYYGWSENAVIEEPLASVDIESESQTGELKLEHPILNSLRRRLDLGLALSVRKSETFLLGEPFSFTHGAEDGESRVTALRFIQSFVDRSPSTALALRSTFSLGVDLFGPTIHGKGRPDSQFLTWLGQVQYARRLGDHWGQVIFRGDVQLSDDALLSLERFAVGGAGTVRGYRENELVRDNGYSLSVEWRYPIWPWGDQGASKSSLQLAPFMDFGSAWNKGETAHEDRLHSIGVGLLYTYGDWIDAELYLAHELEKAAEKADHDLQDDGIHFRVTFNVL
jgi:hemolysin activation/secretion protein